MEWLKNPINVLIISITGLTALGLLLYSIQHGLKLKLDKGTLTAEDSVDTTTVTHVSTPSCDGYQTEHMAILTELRDSSKRIETKVDAQSATLSTQDAILGVLVSSSKLSLKKIMEDKRQLQPGEEINGDLRETFNEVKAAELQYKGMRQVGGGA